MCAHRVCSFVAHLSFMVIHGCPMPSHGHTWVSHALTDGSGFEGSHGHTWVSHALTWSYMGVPCPHMVIHGCPMPSQMGLDLKGHVVILDEAHNMEDSAREAASITLASTQLADVANEIQQLSKGRNVALLIDYKHTHAHTHTHTRTHTRAHMHTHAHTRTHMHTHAHTCTHMHTHAHVCTQRTFTPHPSHTHTLCTVVLPSTDETKESYGRLMALVWHTSSSIFPPLSFIPSPLAAVPQHGSVDG